MKVKTLVRNPDDYIRETKQDIHRVPRNYDPVLHPFEVPREYTRAMNAVKLEKVFAKPFLGSLDGHRDSIYCLGKHPERLSYLYSGAYDGELKLWDVARRKVLLTVQAHDGFVRAMTFSKETNALFTVGDDRLIKHWKAEAHDGSDMKTPVNTISSNYMLTGISHHRSKPFLATCGEGSHLWEQTRAQPIKTFHWGVDSLQGIKFNQVEENILGACGSDRSIMLYDLRENVALKKVVLKMQSNAICWNPMEAFTFIVANEDYNVYTFDMRNLAFPKTIHKGHISAVIDVDYAPTGKEFVTGGYDKSVRIFEADSAKSRDVYHTKRMQRLKAVAWSMDNRYIYTASDEMNIRIWKARASEKLGLMTPREKRTANVNAKLIDKFVHHPQVKRIHRHRHVPSHIYNGTQQLHLSHMSKMRKEFNVRTHSKRPKPVVHEKEKVVVSEDQ